MCPVADTKRILQKIFSELKCFPQKRPGGKVMWKEGRMWFVPRACKSQFTVRKLQGIPRWRVQFNVCGCIYNTENYGGLKGAGKAALPQCFSLGTWDNFPELLFYSFHSLAQCVLGLNVLTFISLVNYEMILIVVICLSHGLPNVLGQWGLHKYGFYLESFGFLKIYIPNNNVLVFTDEMTDCLSGPP